ncbi:hypothetical protein ACWEFJ_28500 [Actinosynnema sp. NPDC004786]
MNAVELILRFVAVFRRFGVPVTFEPGWEARGNGQSAAYVGGLVHHTVTPVSDVRPQSLVTGRPDLSGPLCNLAGLGSGGIHVVAAHPANHAGASGGPSMGPLPVTRAFNRLVVGLEIVYPGTSPMTDAQYRTAQVFALACHEIFGDVERCRAHFETSIEGKIDIAYAANPTRSYDMNQFRRGALVLHQEDDMALTPDDTNLLLYRTPMWAGMNLASVLLAIDTNAGQAHVLLAAMQKQLAALIAAVQAATNDPDITVEQLDRVVDAAVQRHTPTAEQVAAAQLPHIQAAVRDVLGEDNADQADQIVDRIFEQVARRLAATTNQEG